MRLIEELRRPAAMLFVLALASGCGSDRSHSSDMPEAAAADTAGAETYAVTGRVMSVTPDRDFVMVRHDVIGGFMDAMTMPFAVRDASLLTGLSAGDSVGFVIEVSRGEIQITSIEEL